VLVLNTVPVSFSVNLGGLQFIARQYRLQYLPMGAAISLRGTFLTVFCLAEA
jgi:hypothetical protein